MTATGSDRWCAQLADGECRYRHMFRTLGYVMAAYVGINIYAALLPHSPAAGAFFLAGMMLSVRPMADLLSRSMREGTIVDHEPG